MAKTINDSHSKNKNLSMGWIFNFIIRPEVLVIFISFSVIFALHHININDYGMDPPGQSEHMNIIEGKSDYFSEANNGGFDVLLFFANKVTKIGYYWTRMLLNVFFLSLFLILFYKLTKSYVLTSLFFAYPPLVVDFYLGVSAFVLAILTGALLLYLNKKRTAAFALAVPLAIFRHEGVVFFLVILAYEFLSGKHYLSFKKFFDFLLERGWCFFFIISAVALYAYLQWFFFGHPFANLILNTSQHISLNFSWYDDAIRWIIILLMAITSYLLYSKSDILFWMNSSAAAVYIFFAFLSFEYTFYALMKYYGWMVLFTILAIGLQAGILKKEKFSFKA